jgi:2,3-bisphosphoglycerate-independent phosphoglycerate mutase
MKTRSPIVLIILDGWGYHEGNHQNDAIAKAKKPQWDSWWQSYPHLLLDASGTQVGLPDEQMGNSEVGHMHIGAGRLIQQDFTRINSAINNGEFANHPSLNQAITRLNATGSSLHIMGLLSPGGVHSHEEHLFALLALCYQKKFSKVKLHLFLDGRDTPPQSALESIDRLNKQLEKYPVAQICSLTGRYYAMDRDNRWERVEPVYVMLTQGISNENFSDAHTAIEAFYERKIHDEFIPPTLLGESSPITDGDAVLFFNFRADRARQLTSAFVSPEFVGFNRIKKPQLSYFISMTQYDELLSTTSMFTPIQLNNTLGEVLSSHGLTQLRIAETEKYAHVTFFFNGGIEKVFPKEDRILIPSPKVATYDLKPEMSAPELTHALVKAIDSQSYDVIICNYANADMVGHSGNFAATQQAIECIDKCLHDIWTALDKHNGRLLVTADHGNAESMYDETTHQPQTAHTNNPVPLLFIGDGWHFIRDKGCLSDIAPTILTLLGINPPKEMTGQVLMAKDLVHDA